MTTHEEIAELLGVYALDAVDPEEEREIEEHLATCPRCRAEVAGHREVAALLGNGGGVAPEGIWERIAAELALEESGGASPAAGNPPALGSRAAPAPPRLGAPSRLDAGRPAGEITPLPRAGAARRRWRWPAISGAALGALAAALAVVVGVLSARVSDLDHQVSAVESALGAQSLAERALAASLDPNDVQVKLAPSPTPAAPAARLIVDRQSDTAFFVSTGLAALPGNRTYQLWSLVAGKPVSIALLGSRPAPSELRVSPNMSTFMVTAEPEGGTPQPTGPVIVQGSLSRSA